MPPDSTERQLTPRLLTTDWTLYDLLLEAEEWLFADESSASRFPEGARALVYVTNRRGPYSGFVAAIRAAGPMEEVPMQGRTAYYHMYPYRVPVDVLVAVPKPVPVKPMIHELSFIPNGRYWGMAFKGRPGREIPEADYKAVFTALEQAG